MYFGLSPTPSTAGNTSGNKEVKNGGAQSGAPSQEQPKLPDRVKEKMVLITGGAFQMGRDDVDSNEYLYGVQSPAHLVSVDSFYIDRTEVTNQEYAEFVQSGRKPPSNWVNRQPPAGQEKFPVTFVSYTDAKDFAEWISKRDSTSCQVPTEEEWEYTARSGKQQYIFPWGNEWISGRVNIANGNTGTPVEVGTTADETTGGVKEMMGNVMEWTSTTFDYYPKFAGRKRDDIGANIFMTVRGLSFAAEKEKLERVNMLLTYRQGVPADSKREFLGFRLVCRP